MSLDINGEKCAVCNAYLFEEDDVVYCPVCGAPHHRDCYNAVGHCGLDEYHGTDKQYSRPQSQPQEQKTEQPVKENLVNCAVCGEKYDIESNFCPKCNAPNITRAGGGFVAFDLLGGVPSNTDLGDGVTAGEAAKFVVNNTHRYIPKFLRFKKGKKASWNWLAFLTPCGWLMSRKMYLLGGIIGALQIAFSMFAVPFSAAVNMLDTSAAKNYIEYSNIILENTSRIGEAVILTALLGSLLDLILRVVIAVFGDLIYKKRVISKVSEIKTNSENKDTIYRKTGGVSIVAAALGYFAVSYLPTIIAYTFGMM